MGLCILQPQTILRCWHQKVEISPAVTAGHRSGREVTRGLEFQYVISNSWTVLKNALSVVTLLYKKIRCLSYFPWGLSGYSLKSDHFPPHLRTCGRQPVWCITKYWLDSMPKLWVSILTTQVLFKHLLQYRRDSTAMSIINSCISLSTHLGPGRHFIHQTSIWLQLLWCIDIHLPQERFIAEPRRSK